MRLRRASERRAPLAYQGDGSYTDLGTEPNDEPGESQPRPHGGTITRSMAPHRGRRADRGPSPSGEKQRDMLTLFPAPFPTLEPGEKLEDRVKYGTHGISMLMLQRFGKNEDARTASYRDTDLQNVSKFHGMIDALPPKMEGPEVFPASAQGLGTWLRRRIGIDDSEIPFRALYWSLRQKIIDEILLEAMDTFPGGGFAAVKTLLNLEDDELPAIMNQNAATTMKEDQTQAHRRIQEGFRAHHLERFNQGQNDVQTYLLLPESSDDNKVIDPEFPHPCNLLLACIYLLENHLPMSLLGEWETLMLPQVISRLHRTSRGDVNRSNSTESSIKDKTKARRPSGDRQCNPSSVTSSGIPMSTAGRSPLEREIATSTNTEEVGIAREVLVSRDNKRTAQGGECAADATPILPSLKKNATGVESRTTSEERGPIGGLKLSASGPSLKQVGEVGPQTPVSLSTQPSTAHRRSNKSREEATLDQAPSAHAFTARTENASLNSQNALPSHEAPKQPSQQQAGTASTKPVLGVGNHSCGPKVGLVRASSVTENHPALPVCSGITPTGKHMSSGASLLPNPVPRELASPTKTISQDRRVLVQQIQPSTFQQHPGRAIPGSKDATNTNSLPLPNKPSAEPQQAYSTGIALSPLQRTPPMARGTGYTSTTSYNQRTSEVQVAQGSVQGPSLVRRASASKSSDHIVSVPTPSAHRASTMSPLNRAISPQGAAFPASPIHSKLNPAGQCYLPRPSVVSPQQQVQHMPSGLQTSSSRPAEYSSHGTDISAASAAANTAHRSMSFSGHNQVHGSGVGKGQSSSGHAYWMTNAGQPSSSNAALNQNYPDTQARRFQGRPGPVHSLPNPGPLTHHLNTSSPYRHAPTPQALPANFNHMPTNAVYMNNQHNGNTVNGAGFSWNYPQPTVAPVAGMRTLTEWSLPFPHQNGNDIYPAFPRYTSNNAIQEPPKTVDESMMDPRLLGGNNVQGQENKRPRAAEQ